MKKVPFAMGNLPDIADSRRIFTYQFQKPVSLPPSFKTDISMLVFEDQGPRGTCTWNSLTYALKLLHFRETGKMLDLSWRHGYAMTKFQDGIQDIEGSFFSVALKIGHDVGCAEASLVPNDTSLPHKDFITVPHTPDIFQNAYQTKIKSFASVIADPFHLKQALVQNGFFLGAIIVGTDMYTLPLKPLPFYGRHALFFFGYEDIADGSTDFYFLNSWSAAWGDKGVGKINSKDYFTPIGNYIDSIYSIVDVPQELIDEAKRRAYRPKYNFSRTLKQGDNGDDVLMLQDILKYEGCISPLDLPVSTKYYGPTTAAGLLNFQLRYQVAPLRTLQGLGGMSFGPATMAVMKQWYASDVTLLDQWALAIRSREGYFAPGENKNYPNGTPAWRNKNPGNIKYVGQARAIGQDKSGFCVFATYADGYAELKDFLVRCATLPDTPNYKHDMTLLQFFHVYAPAGDNNDPASYAYQVAKALKVEPTIQISQLIK